MKIAPILVTVYNREEHFKKCIESMMHCDLAKESHLFVAIDFPHKDSDSPAHKEIVKYSKNITGFKDISLLIRPENYGTNKNGDLARDEIFNIYDRLIMSEDDNIFSKNFLYTINKCLEIYNERKDIFSVSGWNMPFKIPKNYSDELYLWQGFSAWGVGIWREKWKQMNYSLDKVQYWLNNKVHIEKLNNVSQHYYYALLDMKKSNSINGDGYICNYLIENNMYTIYPSKSLTRNIGHDGLGNNKYLNAKINNQKISNDKFSKFPIDIKPDKKINIKLWWYFSNLSRLKNRFVHLYLKFFIQ